MSVFMLKDICISRIITYITILNSPHIYNAFNDLFNADLTKKEGRNTLGLSIKDLNATAFELVYQLKLEDVEREYVYEYADSNIVQVYKDLQCLLYQCSSGDLDQTDLFKTLSELKNYLGELIITHLPVWEAAPWGE